MFLLLSTILALFFPQNLWSVLHRRRIYTTPLVCNRGYTLTHGYCWMVDTEQYTHYHANQACRDREATLAFYDKTEVNEAIIQYANKNHTNLWIGLKCDSSEECETATGSVTNSSKFFYGGTAIPTVGKCVMLETVGILGGKWISVTCNARMAFVCGYVAVG